MAQAPSIGKQKTSGKRICEIVDIKNKFRTNSLFLSNNFNINAN